MHTSAEIKDPVTLTLEEIFIYKFRKEKRKQDPKEKIWCTSIWNILICPMHAIFLCLSFYQIISGIFLDSANICSAIYWQMHVLKKVKLSYQVTHANNLKIKYTKGLYNQNQGKHLTISSWVYRLLNNEDGSISLLIHSKYWPLSMLTVYKRCMYFI